MPIDTLNADHLGQVGGGFEPQRANNALLYIAGLTGNENDVVTLSLTSFSLPKSNINPIEVMYLNQTRKFAGRVTFEELNVVCNDFVDGNTAKVLADWNYLSHNPVSGKTSFAATYKKNGRAVLYDPSGGSDREWECQGMWITAFDPGDVDFEGDDRLRITMTIAIDKAIYRPSIAA